MRRAAAAGRGSWSFSRRVGPSARRVLVPAALAMVAAAVLVLAAPMGVPIASAAASSRGYDAEIRRTAHGIPHVKARSYADAGFGNGYAFAEDNLCELAEEIVTISGRRSLHFGPERSYGELGSEANNLVSDFHHAAVVRARTVERLLARSRRASPPGPSKDARALVRGYAAGYNAYLRKTGVDRLPDPRCRGAAWVRPIRALDIWRRIHHFANLVGTGGLRSGIVAAHPPTTTAPSARAAVEARALHRTLHRIPPGSNAFGLGGRATANGRGMVLAHPHFPWDGPLRFHEVHLTIPGEIDVLGATLHGFPGVAIGHNARVAWSHTVSTAANLTAFALKLVPGQPTRYLIDGRRAEMRRQRVTVPVRRPGGPIEMRHHTLYGTRYGPVFVIPGVLDWTEKRAYALRDANTENLRSVDTWLAIGRARSSRGVLRALRRHQGLPLVNTIAADRAGEALYANVSAVPHVTDAKLRRCVTSPEGRRLLGTAGPLVLDGWRSRCDWGDDAGAVARGTLGPSRQPVLVRRDFVANSNDSHWLTNPARPLRGFPQIIGRERTELGLRTRLGLLMIRQRMAGTDGLPGRRFTLGRLQRIVLNNRNYGGELVRDDLVALCRANPTVQLGDGTGVDLRAACDALARWNLRDDLDSVGVHVFREFMLRRPPDWLSVPFDPDRPLTTPNSLDRANPSVLRALAEGVRDLQAAGIPLDAKLGSIQYEPRGDERIPIHGGLDAEGIFNMTIAPLQGSAGYAKVIHGSSFLMVAGFTPRGPVSRAILTYSQSTDPTSPHHADQTRLYSRKQWVRMRFAEREILADPQLRAYRVRSRR